MSHRTPTLAPVQRHHPPGSTRLAAVEWYDGMGGAPAAGAAALVVALDNGRIQLMQHESDDSGVCIDTGMRVRGAKWSHNGTVGGAACGHRREVAGAPVEAARGSKELEGLSGFRPGMGAAAAGVGALR